PILFIHLLLFAFHRSGATLHLHSFPTRRSSDLKTSRSCADIMIFKSNNYRKGYLLVPNDLKVQNMAGAGQKEIGEYLLYFSNELTVHTKSVGSGTAILAGYAFDRSEEHTSELQS